MREDEEVKTEIRSDSGSAEAIAVNDSDECWWRARASVPQTEAALEEVSLRSRSYGAASITSFAGLQHLDEYVARRSIERIRG